MRGAAAAIAALALLTAPGAAAAPPAPAGLAVEGGDDWRPQRAFRLLWTNPSDPPPVAVHYRLLDPHGSVVVPATRISWPAASIEDLTVPATPGAYRAEVWLEDASGAKGPAASAALRFDNARPAAIEPLWDGRWLGRTAFPLALRLSRPQGTPPAAGIRGYAVSLAPPPGAPPCAGPDRCTDAETDLRGGAAGDTLTIPELSEGVTQVRAVAVSGSGMRSESAGSALLRVDRTDPTTVLEGIPAGWSRGPVRLLARASDGLSGMRHDGLGAPPFTAIAIDGRAPTVATGPTVAATAFGDGVHRVAHYARDLAGNANDGGHVNGIANRPPTEALVRIDSRPPAVAFANAQDPADPELIRARVADPLSGPDGRRGWIGVRPAGSGDAFAPLPPLPAPAGELRARWDSDSFPRGSYEFRALAYDRAGNSAATARRAGGGPMILRNPIKAATELRGRLVRGTVPYGRGARLSGRLLVTLGRPLAGRQLRIVERFAGGRLPDRVSTARTGAGGAFRLRLGPGPSREVRAVFAGERGLTRAAAPPLRLAVRGAVRLRVSSRVARVGGAPIVFAGRVMAAPGALPPSGKWVQLHFRLPGTGWSEFRTVRTDRDGRFRYAYRFSNGASRGARFQFRAYAPAQDDWPYEPAGSKPVVVRGL